MTYSIIFLSNELAIYAVKNLRPHEKHRSKSAKL